MKPPEGFSDIRLASSVAARAAHDLNNVAAVFSRHVFLLRNSAESPEEAFESMEKAIAISRKLMPRFWPSRTQAKGSRPRSVNGSLSPTFRRRERRGEESD